MASSGAALARPRVEGVRYLMIYSTYCPPRQNGYVIRLPVLSYVQLVILSTIKNTTPVNLECRKPRRITFLTWRLDIFHLNDSLLLQLSLQNLALVKLGYTSRDLFQENNILTYRSYHLQGCFLFLFSLVKHSTPLCR